MFRSSDFCGPSVPKGANEDHSVLLSLPINRQGKLLLSYALKASDTCDVATTLSKCNSS